MFQNSSEIQETLARRRDKLHAFGVRMQPFVVVVGTVVQPSGAYIVAGDVMWKVSTPLKAVDVCFKSFHVFHASYPAETFVWLFLQKLIYKITTGREISDCECSSARISGKIVDLNRNHKVNNSKVAFCWMS